MNQQFMGLNTRSLLFSELIAGAVMGVLSHVPLVACLNCLLYGWVWGGAIGAVYLYRRYEHQAALTNTQGLVIGAVAGAIGAVVGGIAAALFGGLSAAVFGALGNVTQNFGDTITNLVLTSSFSLLNVIRDIVIYGLIGALGGVIATALIWKAPTGPVPPYTPPPSGPTA